MSSRPELEVIIEELRDLGDRELRFTLSAMRPQEQAQILEMLDGQPATSLSFETLAGISPWLTKRLEAARQPDRMIDGQVAMSKATADAVTAAFEKLGSTPNPALSQRSERRSASWFDRLLRRSTEGARA